MGMRNSYNDMRNPFQSGVQSRGMGVGRGRGYMSGGRGGGYGQDKPFNDRLSDNIDRGVDGIRAGRFNQANEEPWARRGGAAAPGVGSARGGSVNSARGGRGRWDSASGSTGNGVGYSSQPPPLMQNYQNSQQPGW